jgi:hypothetical protein
MIEEIGQEVGYIVFSLHKNPKEVKIFNNRYTRRVKCINLTNYP